MLQRCWSKNRINNSNYYSYKVCGSKFTNVDDQLSVLKSETTKHKALKTQLKSRKTMLEQQQEVLKFSKKGMVNLTAECLQGKDFHWTNFIPN